MIIQPQAEQKQVSLHTLTLENRENLKITGVLKTINYDQYSVTLETDVGMLLIGGASLAVNEISTQTGEVSIQGTIEYMQYQGKKQPVQGVGGFFKRLVR